MNPLLIKLMMMTTSPNDGEALTAMRKANAMLAEANVNWAEFLSAVKTTNERVDQTFRTPPSQRQARRDAGRNDDNAFSDVGKGAPAQKFDDAAVIDPMFEEAFKNASGGFRDFVDSVHQWWEEKHFLTEKQYYAIKRAAGEA